MIMI